MRTIAGKTAETNLARIAFADDKESIIKMGLK